MENAMPSPTMYTQGFILKVMVDLLDELRQAQSLSDVNIAAGKAWLSLEPYLLNDGGWPLVLDLASQGPDELGEVVDLPL